MDPKDLAKLTEDMRLVAATLAKELFKELREELRSEQQSSLEAIRSELSETMEKVNKRVDELEQTVRTTPVANRMLEESVTTYHLFPTSVATTTTISVVSSTAPLPTQTITTAGPIHSTLVSTVTGSAICHNTAPVMSRTSGHPRLNRDNNVFSYDFPDPVLTCNPTVGSVAPPSHPSCAQFTDVGGSLVSGVPSASHATSGGSLICSVVPFDGSVSWADGSPQISGRP